MFKSKAMYFEENKTAIIETVLMEGMAAAKRKFNISDGSYYKYSKGWLQDFKAARARLIAEGKTPHDALTRAEKETLELGDPPSDDSTKEKVRARIGKTVFPSGAPKDPVYNMADAKKIAQEHNITPESIKQLPFSTAAEELIYLRGWQDGVKFAMEKNK